MFRPVAAIVSCASASLLRVQVTNHTQELHVPHSYGSSKCPCVGFDEVGGTTEVTVGGQQVDYPADLGASCQAWDEKRAPGDCTGLNPASWCSKQWCYVDPCNCDIPDIPKISAYLPDSKYQGKPVYYSYETCGAKDEYTTKNHKEACVNQPSKDVCNGKPKCKWSDDKHKCGGKDVMGYCLKPLPVNTWGENGCRCVGIDNQPGTLEVHYDENSGETTEYPADTGATCDSWDLNRHPECKGADKPGWCTDRWCFVDPCSCNLDVPPSRTNYLPDSNFQGNPIFYSFATCATENRYSKTHKKRHAEEQAVVCSSAWVFTPVAALLLSILTA